jgi:hypothetical protein
MVTDLQVKRLWMALSSGKTLPQSADKAGMDEKTARKYRRLGRLPSEVAPERTWRTREDPFAEVLPTGRQAGRRFSSSFKRPPAWRPRRCLGGFRESTRGSSTTPSCGAFSEA